VNTAAKQPVRELHDRSP